METLILFWTFEKYSQTFQFNLILSICFHYADVSRLRYAVFISSFFGTFYPEGMLNVIEGLSCNN